MAKQYVDEQYIKEVGKKIAEIRESKGLSQEDLSRLIDIDTRQVGRIERAEHDSSISMIKKLADALNLKMGDLLDL